MIYLGSWVKGTVSHVGEDMELEAGEGCGSGSLYTSGSIQKRKRRNADT